MTRCCISGASGFIGSHVVSYLIEHTDWHITAIASWRHKGNPLRLAKHANNPRLSIVTHDLTGDIPEVGDYDYILNLASESHVDRSIKDPVPFIENNISSTLQLLEYARKHPCKSFIQFSTDEVYGSVESGETMDEWATLVPRNPYSASKASQEMIAMAYYHTYKIPVIITNTNNGIGAGQDPEKFVPKVIAKVLNGEEVSIHTNRGQQGSRFYNPVTNIADALLFILQNLPATPNQERPDRYNLGGGKQLTNLELAQAVADALGKSLRYQLVDVSALRPGYDQHYPDASGRLNELGWATPVTFEEELKRLVAEL